MGVPNRLVMQVDTNQLSTQSAILSMKSKLDTISSDLDGPFQRNPSSTSIRSMSPSDALSASPPVNLTPPVKPLNGSHPSHTVVTALNFNKTTLPASPSVSVSAFSLPADKNDNSSHRGSFDQTRGNWGNRIVLTT